MKKIWIALAMGVCLVFAHPAGAADNGSLTGRDGALLDPVMKFRNPSWGSWDMRLGISQFPFLKIGQGARAEGMGGAYTAIADDISASFFNPAGLGHIESFAYTLNYTRWLADSKLFSGALAFNAGFGVIGLNIISFAAQEFEVTTPTAPWGTGTRAQVGDIAIGASFTKRLTDKLMLGGQVRWIQEDLYLVKVSNFDFSIGTFFYTGFKSTRMAMSFQNLGPNVKTVPGGETYGMPVLFNVGAAMEVWGEQGSQSYVTLAGEHQFVTDYKPVNRVGVEAWFMNAVALRAGYRTGFELENWSVGAGLKHEVTPGKLVTIDVSYHNEKVGLFAAPLRVSVGGTF